MSNFRPSPALLVAAVLLASVEANAQAQQQVVQGFAVDRLYLSPPAGGWFVMDNLDLRGGLGGAASFMIDYAHDPVRVRDGADRLAVVSNEALARFGFAATYDRFRLSIGLDMPLDVDGHGGNVGAYQFVVPSSGQPYTPNGVNPSTATDAFADARVGVDARVYGDPGGPLRVGVSGLLFIPSPNTNQTEYLTDGTFRAMLRLLFAGNAGPYSYAGHLGVHVRPVDVGSEPIGPHGSELLFGLAVGRKFSLGERKSAQLVVGPEIFGETAFNDFFQTNTTGLEGLLTGRVEGTGAEGPQLRGKVGVGAGLDQHFGVPEWRMMASIEVFGHGTDTDGDGIYDAKDACPHEPGVRTNDRKTNGCPADRDSDDPVDIRDECPNVPSADANDDDGCPEPPAPATPAPPVPAPMPPAPAAPASPK